MAIELDDKSHNSSHASKRDQAKNFALASAGVNLVRVNVKWEGNYDLSFLNSINAFREVVSMRTEITGSTPYNNTNI